MTEKEVQELRRENESLRQTNTILFAKLTKVIGEYNKMLASITKHNKAMRDIVKGCE